MTFISTDIHLASDLLKKEEVVAIPTETVYGLAGNIYSQKAIHKIFELKKRPLFNPLIVHVSELEQIKLLVSEIPEQAIQLAQKFWPGPLTFLLPKKSNVSDLITAGSSKVAVRIPAHPLTLQLLHQLDFPLAAPSANPYKRISPTSAQHVASYFKEDLALILDGGICPSGIESTILGFENKKVQLYRYGAISKEDIEREVGKVSVMIGKTAEITPGTVLKHYSPKTKLIVSENVSNSLKNNPNTTVAFLLFQSRIQTNSHQIVLSENGNLQEAASKLYAALHYLDSLQVDLIIAEKFPENGLGESINDRLNRASYLE